MGFHRYTRHTFYFDYLLARETEDLEVEVGYTVDDDEVILVSVKHNGVELETTEAEDNELYDYALDDAQEAMAGAQADYGDYIRDSQRDNED
jgi:hypothetical protein